MCVDGTALVTPKPWRLAPDIKQKTHSEGGMHVHVRVHAQRRPLRLPVASALLSLLFQSVTQQVDNNRLLWLSRPRSFTVRSPKSWKNKKKLSQYIVNMEIDKISCQKRSSIWDKNVFCFILGDNQLILPPPDTNMTESY